MSNTDNIYNILNNFNKIAKEEPAPVATTAKAKTKLQESMEQVVNEKYMGFKKTVAAIKKGGSAEDPEAVAAAIGRKKHGKEKFQKAAAAGKKLGEGQSVSEEQQDESALQYSIGVKKHGKPYMTQASLLMRNGGSQKELGALKDRLSKAHKGKITNEDHGPENPDALVNYGEYDREGDMAKDDLYTIDNAAEELYSILRTDDNLPEWVQKKITLAVDYLDTVRDYMKAQSYGQGVAEGEDSKEIGPGWKTEYGIVDRVDGNSVIVKTSQGKMRVNITDIKTAEAPEQGVAEGSEQVYNIVAVDKGNAMAKPKKLTYKAGSIEEVFDALAANDWYPLEINGVEVINGNHLKQGVAEGSMDPAAEQDYAEWEQILRPNNAGSYALELMLGQRLQTDGATTIRNILAYVKQNRQVLGKEISDETGRTVKDAIIDIRNKFPQLYQAAQQPQAVAEGFDDMIKDVNRKAKEKGTGKFDKKEISTGTVYTRKYNPKSGETDDTEKRASGRPKKSAFEDMSTIDKMIAEAFGQLGERITINPDGTTSGRVAPPPLPGVGSGIRVAPMPATTTSKPATGMGTIKGGVFSADPPKPGEQGVAIPQGLDEVDAEMEGMRKLAGLKGGQKKLDRDQDGKLTAKDFDMLRKGLEEGGRDDYDEIRDKIQWLQGAPNYLSRDEAKETAYYTKDTDPVWDGYRDDDDEVGENLEVRANPAGASSAEQAKKIGAQFPQQNGKEPNLAYKIGEDDMEVDEQLNPALSTPTLDKIVANKAAAVKRGDTSAKDDYDKSFVGAYSQDEQGQKKYSARTTPGVINKIKDTFGLDKPDSAYGPKAAEPTQSTNEDDMEEGNVITKAMADKTIPVGAPIPGTNLKKTKHLDTMAEGDAALNQMRRIAGLKEGGMSPISGMASDMQKQQGSMNISTNQSSDGTKSVTITAAGDAASDLMQMLKLAGMGSGAAALTQAEPEIVLVAQDSEAAMEEEKDPRYQASTTPDEQVAPIQALTKGGNGDVAGQEKKMKPGGYQFGDNNLAMQESLSVQLMKEYNSIKVKK